MKTNNHDSRPRARTADIRLANATGWGLIGGLAGTFVMDLCLMGALSVAGLPSLTCFSMVGDTAARFFTILGDTDVRFSAIIGRELAGGVPMGIAVHYLIGPAIGASFGAIVARVDALKLNTLKKSVALAVLYVEILSQPLLAAMPVLLGWTLPQTLKWYGGALCAHLIAGAVLGLVISRGLTPEIESTGTRSRAHSDALSV